MKRSFLAFVGVVVLLAGTVGLWSPVLFRVRPPIRVGLLHSLTGPMAISEKSMLDAEMMAIDEVNAGGGLLGRKVEPVAADGRSDPSTFGREAERLIAERKVSLLVGCWSSSCRKSVKQVVENLDHLLIYPVAYEGMEQSPQIIYTGAAANQQVIPTVKWCRDTLGAKGFYLIGTDTLWPHAVNAVVKDQLLALGAVVAGEVYAGPDQESMNVLVGKILEARPDVILSTLEGDTNVPFYKALREKAGSKIPCVTFSMTEDEFRELPVARMTHDYAVCSYFQSIDRPENHEFVRKFKARYGQDRVTCDAIATAYTSLKLWAQAVREAETDQVREVRAFLTRQSSNAPEGVITIDRDTHHTWRPFFVGRIRPDGQVDIVETLAKPILPVPFPFSRTSDEWGTFLRTLSEHWNGGWVAPTTRGSGQ